MAEESGKPPISEYIGDGVYAYFDGYQIWLQTFRLEYPQLTEQGYEHSIALEPTTFDALCTFVEKLNEERRKAENEQ